MLNEFFQIGICGVKSISGVVKLRRWLINRTGSDDKVMHTMNRSGEASD